MSIDDQSMSDRTKKEQYVLYRLEGYGSRAAAKRAGFSGGVPSPGARKLWKMVCMERGCDPDERAGELRSEMRRHAEEVRKLHTRIREHEEQTTWLERKLEAVRLLQCADDDRRMAEALAAEV